MPRTSSVLRFKVNLRLRLSDSNPTPLEPGVVVGGYEVLATLGSGGVGIVYLA